MPELFGAAYWSWWLLAAVLLGAELLLPVTFFLWLSGTAAVMGLATLVVPGMAAQVQWFAFGLGVLLATVATWLWLKRHPAAAAGPLNRRAHQYLGRVLALDQAIVNGHGRVRVDDSQWRVTGPDSPAGTRVKVVGVDGLLLQVLPEDDVPKGA